MAHPGLLGQATMQLILEARSRQAAGITAPPQGLHLDWVKYEDRFPEAPVPTASSTLPLDL
jgi:tRNA U38,U39,U40 pseudouridine synthase TruA